MSLWKQGSVLLGVVCHRQKMEQLGILGERTKVVATEGGGGAWSRFPTDMQIKLGACRPVSRIGTLVNRNLDCEKIDCMTH